MVWHWALHEKYRIKYNVLAVCTGSQKMVSLEVKATYSHNSLSLYKVMTGCQKIVEVT